MAQEEKQQVKSKQRVVDRGEVFTAEREVNAMLDLVTGNGTHRLTLFRACVWGRKFSCRDIAEKIGCG